MQVIIKSGWIGVITLCKRYLLYVVMMILSVSYVVQANVVEGYILGPEDVLEITVWNNPDLKQQVTVRPDGIISVLLVGDLKVSGLQPQDVAQRITDSLKTVINNPKVNVAVIAFRPMNVSVLGAVTKPGVYKVNQSTRLLEVLAIAGLEDEHASLEDVSLTRNDTVLKVNVASLLTEGGFQNYTLQPGDVIFVPEVTRQVYILGEVVKPGAYEIKLKTTPADVLAMAGGPTKRADLEKVKIIRRNGVIQEEFVNLKEFLKNGSNKVLPYLQDGDMIQVAQAKSIDWETIFFFAQGIKTIRDLIVNW